MEEALRSVLAVRPDVLMLSSIPGRGVAQLAAQLRRTLVEDDLLILRRRDVAGEGGVGASRDSGLTFTEFGVKQSDIDLRTVRRIAPAVILAGLAVANKGVWDRFRFNPEGARADKATILDMLRDGADACATGALDALVTAPRVRSSQASSFDSRSS